MMVITNGTTVKTLKFYYDAEGRPMCLDYNGTMYFYITNLQGDVVALADQYGEVIRYEYDTWGKPIVSEYYFSSHGEVMQNNPLRYRGYIYDAETGFYYLQSRYYDPVVGRFINSDGYVSTGAGVLDYNMFAYCNNNPVMLMDCNGDFPELIEIVSSACEGAKELCAIIGIATGVASILLDSENKVLTTVTKICEDVINFDENNVSEADVLKSNYFSSYNGKLVIRTNGDRSWSFGVLFITRETNKRQDSEDIIRHEYGHTKQLDDLGVIKYALCIGLPSWQMWGTGRYYDKPWEVMADVYGDVKSRTPSQDKIQAGKQYQSLSKKYGIIVWFTIQ